MGHWLEGKVAIITGAGRGIGRAAAELLAAEGASVLLVDFDAPPAEEAAARIHAAGGEASVLPGDVTAPDFPERLMQTVERTYGRLHILINNAGFTWDGTIHKMTDEQWQAMLDVHLTAAFRLVRAAAPLMRDAAKREIEQRGAATPRKIVSVSSTSATRGCFGQSNYAAAKAGLIGLTKTLAREWGPFNIQVNSVAFGLIDTRLTRPKESGEKIRREEREIALGIPENLREASLKLIPLGRPGTPREAAGAIFFLASPLSDYVSGHVLEVTGGL